MAAELNHTVVPAYDKTASATFLAEILGLEAFPNASGIAMQVEVGNGVRLAYLDVPSVGDSYGTGHAHYAFLVTDEEFDAAFARIKERGITFWADPGHQLEGQLNNVSGGRGLFFEDPSGHNMELLTSVEGR